MTLSRYFSLSCIASGRSSGLLPVSSHSCWMYVRAGHPAFAQPNVGVHRSTLESWMLSKEISITIFWVFGMTRAGIEPRSSGPLTNQCILNILGHSIYMWFCTLMYLNIKGPLLKLQLEHLNTADSSIGRLHLCIEVRHSLTNVQDITASDDEVPVLELYGM